MSNSLHEEETVITKTEKSGSNKQEILSEIHDSTDQLRDVGDTTDKLNKTTLEKTDRMSTNIGENTHELSDVGDTTDELEEITQEKTNRISSVGDTTEEFSDVTKLDKNTDLIEDVTGLAAPSPSPPDKNTVTLHEEKTFLFDAGQHSFQPRSSDETCIQEQILTHQNTFARKSGKKRYKNLWLFPAIYFPILFMIAAWVYTSSSHIGVVAWMFLIFSTIVGISLTATFYFGCLGWTIHRNANRIETWMGVFVPIFKRRRFLDRFSSLVLAPYDKNRSKGFVVFISTRPPGEFSNPENRNPIRSFFHIVPNNSNHEDIIISPSNFIMGYHHALKGARTAAEYLGWPIVDLSTGTPYMREPESFDSTIMEKWKSLEDGVKTPCPPPKMHIVFRRVKESVMMGRKSKEGEIVWEVVFSKNNLVVEGRNFDLQEIQDMVMNISPFVHDSGRIDEGLVSGIQVFSSRDSASFAEGLSLEETKFIFEGMRAVFLGGSIKEIFGPVFVK